MRRAGRFVRVATSGLVVAGVVAASGAAGHAATSPTTTRAGTTSTALPLLRASDLPAKYTEVAQPVSSTSTSPRYPTVDANCVVNPQVPFSGLVPSTALITWATDKTGVTGGAETTYTFSDVATAKALYEHFADTYTALTKCPSAKQPVPAAGSTPARTIDLGKWATLAIPRVGDEQTGAVLTPPTGANTSRVALWRDGHTVVVLNLRDYAQPKGAFNKLVVTAEGRVQGS